MMLEIQPVEQDSGLTKAQGTVKALRKAKMPYGPDVKHRTHPTPIKGERCS